MIKVSPLIKYEVTSKNGIIYELFYHLRSRSQDDINKIYEYIAYTLCVPDTAFQLATKIMDTTETLINYPERHPVFFLSPWKEKEFRYIPIDNYILFYKIEKSKVYIIRIIYAARDLTMYKTNSDRTLTNLNVRSLFVCL